MVNRVALTDCVAPAMEVGEATRLADARVVLDGRAQSDGVVGGFMLVPSQGATPVDIPGSGDSGALEPAAEPTGSFVWAATDTAAGSTIKRIDLGAGASATTPTTPVPTTRPTAPAPKPTKAPKPPKATKASKPPKVHTPAKPCPPHGKA